MLYLIKQMKTRDLLLAGLFLLGLVTTYSPLATNQYTPRGDGSRIMPYVEFVEQSGKIYPLWNPFKLGGVPVHATPERYVWVSWLINGNSPYRNFQLNLVFFMEVVVLCLVLFFLAKKYGLSSSSALVLLIIISNSWYIKKFVFSGRINGLLFFILINAALYCYLCWLKQRKAVFFILTALLVGYLICGLGHYLFVMLYPFLLATGWFYHGKNSSFCRALFRATGDSFFISILGMLLWACFFLPEVSHLLAKHLAYQPTTLLIDWLPPQVSLPNFFFPLFLDTGLFDVKKVYPFVGIACLPLLVLLFLSRKEHMEKTWIIFIACWLFSLVFFAGTVFPFTLVMDFFTTNAILMHIRENAGIQYLFTFSLAFAAGFGFDALKGPLTQNRWKRWLFPLGAFAGIWFLGIGLERMTMSPSPYGSGQDSAAILSQIWHTITAADAARYGVLVFLLVLPYPALKRPQWIRMYIFVLLVLQCTVFSVPTDSSMVENKTTYPAIARYLNQDTTYFRIWSGYFNHAGAVELGMPGVRTINGYSKYFSKEHRNALTLLYKKEITDLRSSWIKKIPAFHKRNPLMLDLLNIKYIITQKKFDNDPYLKRHWERVMEETTRLVWDSKWTTSGFLPRMVPETRPMTRVLWKRKNWQPAIVFFDDWSVSTDPGQLAKRLTTNSLASLETVFLDQSPGIEKTEKEKGLKSRVRIADTAVDRIVLDVETNKNGILFVPEYFDRGWSVAVDSCQKPLLKAFGSFRAVALTPGSHRVEFSYRPVPLYLGGAVSLFAMISCLVVVVCAAAKRRPAKKTGCACGADPGCFVSGDCPPIVSDVSLFGMVQ
jgi:hypothetical protein